MSKLFQVLMLSLMLVSCSEKEQGRSITNEKAYLENFNKWVFDFPELALKELSQIQNHKEDDSQGINELINNMKSGKPISAAYLHKIITLAEWHRLADIGIQNCKYADCVKYKEIYVKHLSKEPVYSIDVKLHIEHENLFKELKII